MPRPDVSVVVVTCNQPLTLPWLLASIAAQDAAGRVEVIVTDDGSRPEMLSIVRHAAARHGLDVRYAWQPDDGFRLARARNNGLRMAQGELCVCVDGDVVLPRDCLRRHREAHARPRRLVCGSALYVYLDDEVPSSADLDRLMDDWRTRAVAEDRYRQRERVASREPWMACLGSQFSVARAPEVRFDEHFVGWGLEDCELACRLYRRHAYEIAYVETLEVFHVYPGTAEARIRHRLGSSHAATVQFLKNALYFRSRYPDADLVPLLRLLLYCHRDPATDRWSTGLKTRDRSVAAVVADAEAWFERHGIPIGPVSTPTIALVAGPSCGSS